MIILKKLNNKGFTLVELLAVLVILVAIMSIAIPSISSSLERSKGKQEESKHKILESAAELYVTDHRNSIKNKNECTVTLATLYQENYIDTDATKDSDGNDLVLDQTCVEYKKSDEGQITYKYSTACNNPCIDTP